MYKNNKKYKKTGVNTMRLLTFKGGIHPPYNKEYTKQSGSSKGRGSKDCLHSFQQHIGAPAKPIVEKGDEVKKGQMIGASRWLRFGKCSLISFW